MIRCSGFIVLALLLAGCVFPPPTKGATSSASYLGDQDFCDLGMVVVSIPRHSTNPDRSRPYYDNLNIKLGGFINCQELVFRDDFWEAQGIIRRSTSRLRALVTETVIKEGFIKPTELPRLYDKLSKVIKGAFDRIFAKWKQAKNFKVEILILSFFVTSPGSLPTIQFR